MSRLEKTAGARSVLTLLLITVLINIGFELGLSLILPVETLKQTATYYAVVILRYMVGIGLPVLLFIRLFRPRYMPVLKERMALPSFSASARTVLSAMIGAVMMELYLILWVLLLNGLGVNPSQPFVPLPEDGAQIILAFAAVAVLPAILEEMLFRGAVLEGLKRELSPKAAVLLTALLFAFMHGTLSGLPTHIALGLVLTLLAYRQNNLQLPMLYHFTHNATTLVLALYFKNIMEGMEAEAGAAQSAQGASLLVALLGVLSMAAMATFAYWRIIRPLIQPFRTPVPAVSSLNDPIAGKGRAMVVMLTVLLFLLLLPSYVLDFFPA